METQSEVLTESIHELAKHRRESEKDGKIRRKNLISRSISRLNQIQVKRDWANSLLLDRAIQPA